MTFIPYLHEQQSLFFSVSLNIGNGWATLAPPAAQGQHSTLGAQLGFSQTNSHLGLGHWGLWHFQSHFGSSQTTSHSGFGAWQWVTQCGALQTVTHLGQSNISHPLSGHLISQSGFSHLTSQIAFLGSAQLVWHLGGSQTGSQIAGQWGSSHFQEHWGWHWNYIKFTWVSKQLAVDSKIIPTKAKTIFIYLYYLIK